MDRLSSVLSAFRPKATSVTRCLFLEKAEGLELSTEASYWLYMMEGELTLQAKGSEPISLTKGDGMWLASGLAFEALQSRAALVNHEAVANLLICEFDFGKKALNPLLDFACQWVKVEKGDEIAQQLMSLNTLLLAEIEQLRCGSQVVLERLAEAYLVHLLRAFMQAKKVQFGLLAGLSDNKLARAIVAIHEAPQQAWQVASLAQQAGMSRSAFSGLFKATMGITPMAYLTLWRMRLAAQRIKRGESNLALLCDELGYQSEAAFRRAFKKVMGVAPGTVIREP
ncbi:AraC family transcriptional regulator [Marinomonas pollencensis]|uniref:AraC-like DNA-binding protein n=1 Tax=Marinomonas pollencensis TaxID=491954 RepID=A0A3E0DPR5_9GAMM|nr:AraC family transcriptional regulator [Marinomonas pollencensis]REG84944.1 AraC-like DNA-binding protein [Marinomonas pollencensis]